MKERKKERMEGKIAEKLLNCGRKKERKKERKKRTEIIKLLKKERKKKEYNLK